MKINIKAVSLLQKSEAASYIIRFQINEYLKHNQLTH